MIFAEMEYSQHYSDRHDELLLFVKMNFADVQSGLQGDSWIWITEGDEKVAIDTFTSMKHQIKSPSACRLVARVIACLSHRYSVTVYENPVFEGHEDI